MAKTKGVHVEKLSRAAMRRSMRLMDMEYKPSEIADELHLSKEQVMRLLAAGAPARRDQGGHFWVHGSSFVRWLSDVAPKNKKAKHVFLDGECYCLACRGVVTYTETRRRNNMVFGLCPSGHKITRFLKKG